MRLTRLSLGFPVQDFSLKPSVNANERDLEFIEKTEGVKRKLIGEKKKKELSPSFQNILKGLRELA